MTAPNRHDSYLESKALTAPPYRLHLMLLEGALRFGRQAAAALQSGDELAASTPLMRLVDIAGELLVGVRQQQSELNARLANLYLYLFQTASVAKINGDPKKLADALELLEFERETWQMVCEKLSADGPDSERIPGATSVSASGRVPTAAPSVGVSTGFSLRA